MQNLTAWVRRHQIISFFALVYVISFGIGISGALLFRGDHAVQRTLQFFMVRLLLYGPALAGMVVARAADKGERAGSRGRRWAAFGISWAAATCVSVIYLMRTSGDGAGPSSFILISCLGALFPAFVISGAFSRISSVRAYLSTLVRPRGSIVWYLVALFAFPCIHLLGNLITRLAGLEGPGPAESMSLGLFSLALITFIHVLFYTGGINEESGWRGFALPRLQAHLCPLAACLVVWGFHMLWELPFDTVFSGTPWPWMSRLVWMPSWSILFVWVYNRTRGSILAPVLFHASMNTMNPLMRVLPASDAGTFVLVGLAAFAVAYDRMWERLPQDSRAVQGP
jgi:membrane protease YdiL (CAAX protease family)